MGDHIPARRAFSTWKIWVKKLKMAKYLWESMTKISERFPFSSMDSRTPLRKGKGLFKIFFPHIYLAIHTQPRKRLESTAIKLLLICFCFIHRQTKSLTPPSFVQIIEHFKISSASCYVSTLTREPVAQRRYPPIHHPAEELGTRGRLKGDCIHKMQDKC